MNDNSLRVIEVDINEILPNRFQPRIQFDEDEILELSDSIKEHGVIQPLVVRSVGDKYEIIAGERRYKASVLAGKETVPVIVKNLNDKESAEIALIENVQRKNLTAIEEALSYKNILEMGYLTQETLAKKIGKSQSSVANKIRLLSLSDEVQEALLENKISERHARSLLKLQSSKDQNKMLEKIINERLTVRKTDEEISRMLFRNTDDESDDSQKIKERRNGENDMNNNMNFNTFDGEMPAQAAQSSFNAFGVAPQPVPETPSFNSFGVAPQPVPETPSFNSFGVAPQPAPETPNFDAFGVASQPAPETPSFDAFGATDNSKSTPTFDSFGVAPQALEASQPPSFDSFGISSTPEKVPTPNFDSFDSYSQNNEQEIPTMAPIQEYNENSSNTGVPNVTSTIPASSTSTEPIIVTDYSKQYDPVMPPAASQQVATVDFKEVINAIRECSKKIEEFGYKVDLEEYDLTNMYQVVFKIDK